MAARPTWRGYLKVSLVSIPVKVFPAAESAGALSFHLLHGECRTRIQQKRWCPSCNREVPLGDLVKGYEFEKGHYVTLTDEDFDKVRPTSSKIIELRQFADETAIDPIYVDRTYYLAPDGPVAAESFAVMRAGMVGKAGIGKLALYGREYLVAVRPRERGLVMYTLHHTAEIRKMSAIDELQAVPETINPDEVKLARQVIGTFESALDLSTFHDDYKDALRKIIDAKIAGDEVVATESAAPPKVVNLMDALKKSLEAVSASKKKPAKAAARKAVAAGPQRKRARG